MQCKRNSFHSPDINAKRWKQPLCSGVTESRDVDWHVSGTLQAVLYARALALAICVYAAAE